MKWNRFYWFLFCVFPVLSGLRLDAAEIYVSAASSLTDACKELAVSYEKKSGDKMVFNFGASSMLARQIEEGAPVDLFISADEARMDFLEKKGLLLEKTRRSLLSNTLVLVVEMGSSISIRSPGDLAKSEAGRIALAEPESVPAGIYAKAYLQKLGLWSQVVQKVIPTGNVRAALAAVESGNVDAAMVYKTDALISKKVKVVYEVPMEEGPKISYPAAVLKDSKHAEEAGRFLKYLGSEESKGIFEKYGFGIQK